MDSERIVLVTGATDGIGHETALQLARRGYHVILHGRSRKSAEEAKRWVVHHAPDVPMAVDIAYADFAVLREVRHMVTDLLARYQHLDVLVNNAGVYANEPTLTVD